MRILTRTPKEEHEYQLNWHRVFAWFPIKARGGWAWLEYVEERCYGADGRYSVIEYNLMGDHRD